MSKWDSLDVTEGEYLEKEDSNEKTKESWATLDEEQTSKLEIEKVPSCLPLDPPCVQENNQQKEANLKVIEEKDIQDYPNQQVNGG